MRMLVLLALAVACVSSCTIKPDILTRRVDGGVILALQPTGMARTKQAENIDAFLKSLCNNGYVKVEEGRVVSSVPKPAADGYILIDYKCK